jgi:ATP-dependent helicase/nuclease subunit A
LTAAERGTALHLAMQHIDFKACLCVTGVDEEIKRLVDKGFLHSTSAVAVDPKKIARFFGSDIGKRALKAENIKREFKFSLLCPAEEFYPGGGNDKILLQGVVDCFFEEDGELVVIDFKTDHVSIDTLQEKTNYYAPQLNAYSKALERITGKHVKERIIYYFALDKYVLVEKVFPPVNFHGQ